MAATGGSGLPKQGTQRAFDRGKEKAHAFFGSQWRASIMIPAAIYLSIKATAGEFDAPFYVVQAIELATGLIQLTLLGKNFKAGLRLSGRLLPNRSQ